MTTSDGAFYRAAVPSGESTGMFLNQIFFFFFFFFFFVVVVVVVVIDISLRLVILNLSGEMNYEDNNFHLCC